MTVLNFLKISTITLWCFIDFILKISGSILFFEITLDCNWCDKCFLSLKLEWPAICFSLRWQQILNLTFSLLRLQWRFFEFKWRFFDLSDRFYAFWFEMTIYNLFWRYQQLHYDALLILYKISDFYFYFEIMLDRNWCDQCFLSLKLEWPTICFSLRWQQF